MERRQVWELPEIHPVITEQRLSAGWCCHCQAWVKPDWPAEVGRSAFGPRLQAWVATVFLVSGSRGRQALRELIGESFAGILPSDRWGANNLVDPLRRQLCWAHLKRDFQALSERKTRAGPLGAWGLST